MAILFLQSKSTVNFSKFVQLFNYITENLNRYITALKNVTLLQI